MILSRQNPAIPEDEKLSGLVCAGCLETLVYPHRALAILLEQRPWHIYTLHGMAGCKVFFRWRHPEIEDVPPLEDILTLDDLDSGAIEFVPVSNSGLVEVRITGVDA